MNNEQYIDYINNIVDQDKLYLEYGKLIYRLQSAQTAMDQYRIKLAIIEEHLNNLNNNTNESENSMDS